MLNWLYTWLGLSNASGPIYAFWSGIFGDLTIFAGILMLYWRHSCHHASCFRIAKHISEGSPYCTTHKPKVL